MVNFLHAQILRWCTKIDEYLVCLATLTTKNSICLFTKAILFQNVRLEETNNGNHLVIRQATPEAEGVSNNS